VDLWVGINASEQYTDTIFNLEDEGMTNEGLQLVDKAGNFNRTYPSA
jgi:hypothetical protein